MAEVRNIDAKNALIQAAGLQPTSDGVPAMLSNTIVPILDITPRNHRIINVVKRVSATGTVYTTPTDKDFYLVATNISAEQTAAGAGTATISGFPKGETTTIILNAIYLRCSAVVDCDSNVSNTSYPFPILMERGSIISCNSSTVASKSVTIYGYTVEPL